MQITHNTKELPLSTLIVLPAHALRAQLWQRTPTAKQADGDASDAAAALKASIARDGVQTPVLLSENGMVVDGLRRIAAAASAPGMSPDAPVPVRVLPESAVRWALLNTITQVRAWTKFQRTFVIYPMVRKAYQAVVKFGQDSRSEKLIPGAVHLPNPSSVNRVTDEGLGFQSEAVDPIKGVELEGLSDKNGRPLRAETPEQLAFLLNTRREYLSHCEGIHAAIEKLKPELQEEARRRAHAFVFPQERTVDADIRIRYSAIASAITGYFNDPKEDTEGKKRELVDQKRLAAFNTLLERWRDPALYSPANREKTEAALAAFAADAWKTPEFAEILAEKLIREGKAMKAAAGRLTA